jgi:hypothetical protein
MRRLRCNTEKSEAPQANRSDSRNTILLGSYYRRSARVNRVSLSSREFLCNAVGIFLALRVGPLVLAFFNLNHGERSENCICFFERLIQSVA